MSLYEQISLANSIREQLAQMQIEDEEVIHNTFDGETDIYECIDWLLAKITDEGCNVEALDSYMEKLKQRKLQAENRKERWREILLMAAQATGEKSIKRPCGTIGVSNKPIGILSIDESKVPADYFITSTLVKLDRAKLKEDAIAKGVEGVTLDNGGVFLRIRV